MKTLATFRSTAFPKYPDEDEELINADAWGKCLAEWLRDNLPKHGAETEPDLICEDWGWMVCLKHAEFPLWLGCGVMETSVRPKEGVADPIGGNNEFLVFVEAEPGFLKRLFKRVDTKPAVEKAEAAVRRLLESSPEIHELKWEEE